MNDTIPKFITVIFQLKNGNTRCVDIPSNGRPVPSLISRDGKIFALSHLSANYRAVVFVEQEILCLDSAE